MQWERVNGVTFFKKRRPSTERPRFILPNLVLFSLPFPSSLTKSSENGVIGTQIPLYFSSYFYYQG